MRVDSSYCGAAVNQTEFNLEEGVRLKGEGMAKAVYNRKALFEYAKGLAWGIAKRQGTVTADDVHELLGPVGSQRLGNAAGALFKGIQWECTGWVQSKRPSNHGRMIRAWRLR